MFYFDKINNKKILKSTLLDGVEHFFTTRECPITSGSLHIEDECNANMAEIADYLELNPACLIKPDQKHTSNITVAQRMKSDYSAIDALVLSNKNLGIYLNFADCVPLVFWDVANNVAAIAHAGWRGTADKIAQKVVNFMGVYYETMPKDIVVAIGPAISMKNYQVDRDVYVKLISTLRHAPVDCWQFNESLQKYNVDLKKINMYQLQECGVSKIDLCPYCTYDTNDVFFSYRKENGMTARHSAVLKLK